MPPQDGLGPSPALRLLHAATHAFAGGMALATATGAAAGLRVASRGAVDGDGEADGDGDGEVETTTHDETRMPLPRLPPELLKRDAVAWPTVALCGGAVGLWAAAWRLFTKGKAPWFVAMPMCVVAQYWGFTVMHDAVHNAVAPKHKWLNDVLGHVGGFVLGAPYGLFRHAHLLHHRHTGDHDSAPDGTSLDPDMHTGVGPAWLLPLRWVTLPIAYAHFLAKWFASHSNSPSGGMSAQLKRSTLGFFVAVNATMMVLRRRFGSDAVTVCWLAPQILAFALLAYLFDYIPHRPHVITFKEDPYRSSNVTSLWGSIDGTLWTFVALSQNLHVVHHAWPWVPFYRYRAVWRAVGDELTKHGTRVVPLYLDARSREELVSSLSCSKE